MGGSKTIKNWIHRFMKIMIGAFELMECQHDNYKCSNYKLVQTQRGLIKTLKYQKGV